MKELRKYLLAYLSQEIDLDNLLDWFGEVSSPVGSIQLGLDAEPLIDEVDLRLSELTSGHITQDRFREILSTLVAPINNVIRIGNSQPMRTTAAQQRVVRVERLAMCA